jgi:hypothetical protein
MAASELIANEQNAYIMQEAHSIDSASYRKKYAYLKNANIIYSDSLFHFYAIEDMMTISNEAGTLKCLLTKFDRKAHQYFSQWNAFKNIDTITFKYPIFKLSIKNRVYTQDAKVYMINQADNNILVYNMLQDTMAYIVEIAEQAKIDAYRKFAMNDSGAYYFYKKAIDGNIQDALCTVSAIAVQRDSLYVSQSNYFFFTGGDKGTDTFLTHFHSISLYNKGKYIDTYVPTNIMQKLADSSVKYNSEVEYIYKYNNYIYTQIYNSLYKEPDVFYVVGKYDPEQNVLLAVSKLSEEFKGLYDFSNAYFSNQYYILAKSSKLYNGETGAMIDLAYFNQAYYEKMGLPSFPKYYNLDLNVDRRYYNILYSQSDNNDLFYARIDRLTNKIIANHNLSKLNTNIITKIDPYNNNYIIQMYDNNKVIRHKIF